MARAAAGEPQRFEWLGRRADGRPVWGEVRLRRVRIGGVERILASARDINDRKAAEAALRRANEELELRVAARTAELAASNAALAQEVAEHARAKEALLARTHELEGIFRALPDMYFRLAADQTIVDYRPGSSERLHLAPEALLGRRLREVMPAHICDRFDTAFAADPAALVCIEYRLNYPDGARDYEARFLPLADGTRISVVRDITERKDAERALQEREAQLRETQRIARLGSWQWDVATGALVWDPVLCELYGVTPATAPRDFAGYLALVHPDDRWLARWVCERALTSGEAFAFDHRVLLADGTVRHLHGRGSVTAGGDGRPARLVGSAQDVSERKEAERALQEREERFRRLIENSSDQVMIVDTAGAVTYVGPSVERMLGYTPDEFLGIRPIDIVHPDDVPLVMEAIAHHVAHPGDTTTIQYRIRHKDGSWRVFENLGRTVSPHSADEGLVANCRDVTERASAEAALARAKEEAERANRAKSEFLSRMSHELRTPMNSILGFAQLLARAELPARRASRWGTSSRRGATCCGLINEVLEIARIEAGRENFSLEPVAVAPVLREAFGLVRPLAQQHGVEPARGGVAEAAFVHADRSGSCRCCSTSCRTPSSTTARRPRAAGVRPGRRRGVGGARRGQRHRRPGRPRRPALHAVRAARRRADRRRGHRARARPVAPAVRGHGRRPRARGERAGGEHVPGGARRRRGPLRSLEDTGTYPVLAAPHREATLLYVEDNLAT
jgi:PAS domain S-box-containing protein